MTYTRRGFLKIAGGIAVTATLADRLHAQGELKPEAGAKLRVLRWRRCVQGDEDAWLANTKKFSEQTGEHGGRGGHGQHLGGRRDARGRASAKRYYS